MHDPFKISEKPFNEAFEIAKMKRREKQWWEELDNLDDLDKLSKKGEEQDSDVEDYADSESVPIWSL